MTFLDRCLNLGSRYVLPCHVDFSSDLTGESSAFPACTVIWVAWEKQRRTTELARRLRIPLFRFGFRGPSALRYFILAAQTLRLLRGSRPDILIIQNPSLVLNLWTVCLRPLFGYALVVDRHTNFGLNRPASLQKTVYTWISDFTLRHNNLTILTNGPLADLVTDKGGRAFVLPDKIPTMPPAGKFPLAGQRNLCFICTFASDEPYREVAAIAGRLPPGVHLYITGNHALATWTPSEREDLAKFPNLTLTGFLAEQDYFNLLHGVDIIVDLTTLDHCLVCGAYEALAAGKILVLSEKQVNIELFGDISIYVQPDREGILQGLLLALAEAPIRTEMVKKFRSEYVVRWEKNLNSLINLINELTRHQKRK